MVEHSASVTVKAPVHQVYRLFTHFNDFPKFMSFVKEVTYYDESRSHWVVQMFREYEWDAVNEDCIENQQIGWRSTRGLQNSGKVKFRPLGPERTSVEVYLRYAPPSGPLGELGEVLGVSSLFETALQKDLRHFANMVEQAPSGALDPMSSHYLFHSDSAASKGLVTSKQKEAMARDPMMSPEALAERQARIEQETARLSREAAERAEQQRQRAEQARQLAEQQKKQLAAEAARRRQEQPRRVAASVDSSELDPRHTHAAIARHLGDKDGTRVRDPHFRQDPMTSRQPSRPLKSETAQPDARS